MHSFYQITTGSDPAYHMTTITPFAAPSLDVIHTPSSILTHQILPPSMGLLGIILLLALALTLLLAGRHVIKALTAIIGAFAGAAIGARFGTSLIGASGLTIGLLLGAVIGGILSLLVLKIGIGIVMGYLGYTLTATLVSEPMIPIVVAIALILLGIMAADNILILVSATLGGLLIMDAALALGIPATFSLSIAVAAAALGFFAQRK